MVAALLGGDLKLKLKRKRQSVNSSFMVELCVLAEQVNISIVVFVLFSADFQYKASWCW